MWLFHLFFPQFYKLDTSRYGYPEVFQRVPWTSRYRESTYYFPHRAASSKPAFLRCIMHITKTHLFKYTKNSTTKKWFFLDKNSDIFYISAQNKDYGYSLELPRRGGSNEYPQSMFWGEIRKIMYTPVNPSLTIWKWGLRGSKLYRRVFVMKPGLLCLWEQRSSRSACTFAV